MTNYSKEQPEKISFKSLVEGANPTRNVTQRAKPRANDETLLSDVCNFLGRFIIYPDEHAHVAHALWIIHTHLMSCWECTPRLAVLSPVRECGKTRLLEVTATLVPNPVLATDVTPAYLFRTVSGAKGLPTILHDEIDTVFGLKPRNNCEQVRAMINGGYRRGAVAGRVALKGNEHCPEDLPSYCAVALAGIGLTMLPDTILSRSVTLCMRRRAQHERVEQWRVRTCSAEAKAIYDRIVTWARQMSPRLKGKYPEIPNGVEDRAADIWEPLLSVADACGGKWPAIARVACVALVAQSYDKEVDLSPRLLSDMKSIFDKDSVLSMSTQSILKALSGIEDSPWADMGREGIDAYRLSRLLSPFGIKPKNLRMEKVLKGYKREDFISAWERYLPPTLE